MKILLSFLIGFCSLVSSAQYIKLPDVSLKNLYGKTIRTSYFDNGEQPVVIMNWSKKWCDPCIQLLNKIKDDIPKWEEKYGVRFISINVDSPNLANEELSDFLSELKTFKENEGWEFETYFDFKGEFMDTLGISSAPYFIFIKGGQIESYVSNYGLESKEIEGYIANVGQSVKYYNKSMNDCLKEVYTYKKVYNQINDSLWDFEEYKRWVDHALTRARINNISPISFHGNLKSFWESGTSKMDVNYINNKLDGSFLEWNEEGILIKNAKYYKNRYDSVVTFYYPHNGAVWSRRKYEKGSLVNVIDLFDKNGEDLDFGSFKNGNGWLLNYREDGTVSNKSQFKSGVIKEKVSYEINGAFLSRNFYSEFGERYYLKEMNRLSNILINTIKSQNINDLDSCLEVKESYHLDHSDSVRTRWSEENRLSVEKDIKVISRLAVQKYGVFLKTAKFLDVDYSGVKINDMHSSYFTFKAESKDGEVISFKVYLKEFKGRISVYEINIIE